MAQFVAIEEGIEVNGQTVLSVVAGMSRFKEMALEILEKNGIKDPQPGGWYSQQGWLDAFKDIAEEIGDSTLFNIGKSIPENAEFPPEIDDVEKGLSAIDVAFHMNHRKDGNVMFDPSNGNMLEGIGHYTFTRVGEKEGTVFCDNSYPTEFDRGIITSMARKFEPLAEVELDTSKESRKNGADSCTFIVTW